MSRRDISQADATHVASLDFDHCLYQKGVLLQDAFNKELKRLGIKDVYIGTSRQTTALELANINGRHGASYARFEEFEKDYNEKNPHNRITLDKGLTQDIYLHLKSGTTFEAVKQWEAKNKAEAVCDAMDDDAKLNEIEAKKNNAPTVPTFSTKIEILYSQMRDAASKYPGQPVVFDFYDDSGRVMSALHAYYELHPDLMPANMTLQLHIVVGDQITDYLTPIESTRTAGPQVAADVYQRETGIAMRMALNAAWAACRDNVSHVRNEVTLDKDDANQGSLVAGEAFAKSLRDNELAIRQFATSLTLGLKVGTGVGFALFAVSAGAATYVLATAFIAAGAAASATAVLATNPVALAVAVFAVLALAIGVASAHYVNAKTTPRLIESCFLKSLRGDEDPKAESSVEHK